MKPPSDLTSPLTDSNGSGLSVNVTFLFMPSSGANLS